MRLRHLWIMTILIFTASCQTTFDLPTASPPPSTTPAALPRIPTQTPRLLSLPPLPSQPPPTASPIQPAGTLTSAPTTTAFVPVTTPSATATATEPAPAYPIAEVVGYSVEGRAITAHRFGTGERVLMLIGGMHGGWEGNTIRLMEALIAHFSAPDAAIPNNAALIIITTANPDGLARGAGEAGRFNAHGVDLNRNWPCDWQPEAVWRDRPVSPGAQPLSEPETIALAGYILRVRPAALLFYHSAANGIFAGTCGGDRGSAALARVYGEAVGYRFDRPFTAYPVTGTAPAWANSQGIPAADVELPDRDDGHFDTHLRGVEALLRLLGS